MTDQEWKRLTETPGAQALHRAREILRRPLDDWETAVPASIARRRWAVAVVALAREHEAGAILKESG